MKISRALASAGLAVLALLLAGCTTVAITGAPDLDKNFFGPKKRFAVVTIAAAKTFQGNRSLLDAFKDADSIPGANTQPMINKLDARIMRAFGGSRQFTLLPQARVLSNRAYRNLVEDERSMKVMMFTMDMNVAGQYKYVSDPAKFAALARDLNVDGVIAVTMTFSIANGGGAFSINGLSFGKRSYSATASAAVVAYDRRGEVIWKDSTMKQAEPGDSKAVIVIDTGAFTSADFEKMQPSAVEIGGKAVDVLLSRLDDSLAGKSVSSVQSLK